MSIMEAAERYAEMEKSGLTIAQISAKTGVSQEAIQERLLLLALTPEEQDKVNNNKMSYVQALKTCEQRKRAEAKLNASDERSLHAYNP
jgi:ParB-like chromosome segregation protein Spo0J